MTGSGEGRYHPAMAAAIKGAGTERGEGSRSEPLVWCHPHVRGACVVEDLDGSLWLLFEHEGSSAWTRRRRWMNGVAMLLPFGAEDDLLPRLGYPAACAQPQSTPRISA